MENPWVITIQNDQGHDWEVEILLTLPVADAENLEYILFTDSGSGTKKDVPTPVYAAIFNKDNFKLSLLDPNQDDVWEMLEVVLDDVKKEIDRGGMIRDFF